MSAGAASQPEASGPGRSRALLLATAVLGLAGAAVLVALDPGTTVATRQMSGTDPGLDASSEQRVQFDAEGQSASTVVARSHGTGWGTAIQIIVERPRPALQSLSIRLGTNTLGVAPDDVMLAPPSGDWPAVSFDTTDGGDVTVASEGIDWTSTAQLWLYLPRAAIGEDQPSEFTVAVDLEQASTPSLTSWAGSTMFELSLDETVS